MRKHHTPGVNESALWTLPLANAQVFFPMRLNGFLENFQRKDGGNKLLNGREELQEITLYSLLAFLHFQMKFPK